MMRKTNKLKIKKICAYALSLALIFGTVSVNQEAFVYAEESVEEQTQTVYISTVDEFVAFASQCYIDSWSKDKVIELTADLDFTGADIVMVPVFAGRFNGNGHTISGLDYVGEGYVTALFRYVEESGVIDNLKVEGSITANDEQECVGGIVGSNYGTIKNCTFNGTVSGKKTIGGIAAFNKSTGIIRKCYAIGNISGSYYTGGVTGINHGIITNCKNLAGINDDSEWVASEDEMNSDIISSITGSDDRSSVRSGVDTGGIAGYSDGIIASCYNTGNVGYEHVGYNIGGIAGRQSGIVSMCNNSGIVSGRKDVGGIVGQMEPYIEVTEAETIRASVNELHDLVDKTLTDLTDGKNVLHADLEAVREHADNAVDVGHLMADEVSEFANSNMDQLDLITERLEYVADSMPAVLDSLSAASANMNNMGDALKKLNNDIDIKAQIDANSEDKEKYDAAINKIDSAIERFNDSVKNGSWDEIDAILKDENGNYKDFRDLTDDEKKEVLEKLIDIMQNAEDMSQAAGDIMNGLDTVYDVVKPYVERAVDNAGDDIDRAVNELQKSISNTNDAINGLKGIFTYLNAQSDIRFTRLSDDFDTHRQELYDEIKTISDYMGKLGDDSSAYSDIVNDDMKAVNDKLDEIFNLILDKVESYTALNTDGLYDDVSDEEIDAETTGRVEGCNNTGDVTADINVGGIAGSMAIDNDDLEDSAAGKADVSPGSRYLIKCVINSCRNDGYITAKKDGVGGVAGYMKLGIIRGSTSFGSVRSSDGGYAGGICGQSLSMIVDSYSLCSVEGSKYVGGIAGYGDAIKNCYAMVYLEAESGRVGAIAGQTTAYEDEEEENDDKVVNNYYVDNGVHGIDGISYMGIAEPVTYDNLLKTAGVPSDFTHLRITFRVDDTYVGTREYAYGTDLSTIDFPDIPERSGYYGVWPDLSGRTMIGNLVVNGEYKESITSVESSEGALSGKAYAFISSEFNEQALLHTAIISDAPQEAKNKEYVTYSVTAENVKNADSEGMKVRLLNPYEKIKVYRLDNGVWTELTVKDRGSYVETVIYGTEGVFCIVNEQLNPMIYFIIGGSAAVVICAIMIIKLIRKRKNKSRKGKENDNESEG